jgi:iron complex transport system permease protein
MALNWPTNLLGFYLVPAGAFVGAILTVVLVYNLARVDGLVPLTTLILAGVAIGAFASALTSFLMLRTELQLHRAISFLLGGSPIAGWDPVIAVLPYMLAGMGLLSVSGHMLNVLQFGKKKPSKWAERPSSVTLWSLPTTAVESRFRDQRLLTIVPHASASSGGRITGG